MAEDEKPKTVKMVRRIPLKGEPVLVTASGEFRLVYGMSGMELQITEDVNVVEGTIEYIGQAREQPHE